MQEKLLGKYLNLEEVCTCTQTYRKYAAQIDPYPKNLDETIPALQALFQHVLDPLIDNFGRERFEVTYGFCSADLKRYLNRKDPETGLKNGRITPSRDQHMVYEVNRQGRYYCNRLGAACDFRIIDLSSSQLVEWVLALQLPFDSLYFYGPDHPIHISYSPRHKREIWTFTSKGTPTRKGIEAWIHSARLIV